MAYKVNTSAGTDLVYAQTTVSNIGEFYNAQLTSNMEINQGYICNDIPTAVGLDLVEAASGHGIG